MVQIRKTPLRAKLVRTVNKLSKHKCQVGFFASDGEHPHAKMSYVELMRLHEIHGVRSSQGTIHRRAMEMTAIIHGRSVMAKTLKALKAEIKSGYGDTFGVFGREFEHHLKATLGNPAILPSNMPSTIAHKGKNTPLVDTGDLKNKLHFEVKEK